MRYLRAVYYFLSTLLPYLGLPLLGWGLDDVSGFFSQGARLAYVVVVVALAVAVGYQARDHPEGIVGSRGDEGKRVRRQSVVIVAIDLLLYAMLFVLPSADRGQTGAPGAGSVVRWVGVILSAGGFALIHWSGFTLGRQYSEHVTIQPGHRLITTGPYRLVRHPRYLGGILLTSAVALVFRSWVGLLAVPLLLAIYLLRIRDEEALMHREFGPAWESYCRRSWRLLPGIF
jgi:protein-S-isoprenylcysteine O-methyltransferase Ste14